jgi:hypothetical protein
MIELGLNKPAPKDDSDLPAADTLQFRTAETHSSSSQTPCAVCRGPVEGEYYHIAGRVACSRCARLRLQNQQRRGSPAEFGRAALFGFGAAIAGSILFAIVTYVTKMQFGLLSIVVGVMVGKAVLHGGRGCRGRKYQILAVMLTYGSIATSYAPEIVSGFRQAQQKAQTAAKAGGAAGAQKKPIPSLTPGKAIVVLAVALAFIVAVSLIAPILMISSLAGIINLVIIGIGLRQAWRLTMPDPALIVGPYPPAAPAT